MDIVEEIVKALPIYISCLFKFIVGPLAGYGAGLSILTTIITTVSGMMTSVVAFTFFGGWLRVKVINRWFKNSKRFTPQNRKVVKVWKKYGLPGIAFLTPLILTPIGGTILAVSFGAPRERILLYMLVSATFFAVLFSVMIYAFGKSVMPDFVQP